MNKRAKEQTRRVGFIAAANEILAVPVGKPDPQALDALCREWLVPRLIDKFLWERNIDLQHRNDRMRLKNSTIGPIGKERGK